LCDELFNTRQVILNLKTDHQHRTSRYACFTWHHRSCDHSTQQSRFHIENKKPVSRTFFQEI